MEKCLARIRFAGNWIGGNLPAVNLNWREFELAGKLLVADVCR